MVKTYKGMLNDGGLPAVGFDCERDSQWQNLMTNCGFVRALQIARRIRPGGLGHWATVRSAWVVCVPMGSTQRTPENPQGAATACVAHANAMVARMVLLVTFMLCRSAHFILEQLGSTAIANYPRLTELVGNVHTYKCNTFMGAFGATSSKLTTLRSSASWIEFLARSLSAEDKARISSEGIVTQYINADGKRCVTGGVALKSTQEYPEAYGEAVCACWEQHNLISCLVDPMDDLGEAASDRLFEHAPYAWEDAELEPVAAWLYGGTVGPSDDPVSS